MRCKDIKEWLSEQIDGVLDTEREAQLQEHLATCEHCREDLAALKETVALLQETPELDPPEDLLDCIHQGIEAAAEDDRHHEVPQSNLIQAFFGSPQLRVALAAAVVFCVGLFAFRRMAKAPVRPDYRQQDSMTKSITAGREVSLEAMDDAGGAEDRMLAAGEKKVLEERPMAVDAEPVLDAPGADDKIEEEVMLGETAPAPERKAKNLGELAAAPRKLEFAPSRQTVSAEANGGIWGTKDLAKRKAPAPPAVAPAATAAPSPAPRRDVDAPQLTVEAEEMADSFSAAALDESVSISEGKTVRRSEGLARSRMKQDVAGSIAPARMAARSTVAAPQKELPAPADTQISVAADLKAVLKVVKQYATWHERAKAKKSQTGKQHEVQEVRARIPADKLAQFLKQLESLGSLAYESPEKDTVSVVVKGADATNEKAGTATVLITIVPANK